MKLEIVTETDTIFSGEIDQVTLCSLSGELCILPDHLPLLAEMPPSIVTFLPHGANAKHRKTVVAAGYIHLENNVLALMTAGAMQSLPASEVEKVESELEEISNQMASEAGEEAAVADLLRRKNYLESLLHLPR
jgi:F0F1-type ATP synthase epsilon subunit